MQVASLKDYERKRSRGKTPEPFGKGRKSKAADLRDSASRRPASALRLQARAGRGARRAGRCRRASRSSPGSSTSRCTSRIIPLSYATFEGEIPAGNYGAGTVEIWDHGTYELVEEKSNGGLTVRLHGERLEGLWSLVPAKLSGDPKNWLIVKKKEETDVAPSKPRTYAPMLATLAADVPTGEGWLFEVKWDGFRAIATIRGGDVDCAAGTTSRSSIAFRRSSARSSARSGRPTASSTARSCAVGEDGRATFSAMQQGKEARPTSTSRSTCSRSRGRR
jgi:bifunctional non-homologous end joining protein LigD